MRTIILFTIAIGLLLWNEPAQSRQPDSDQSNQRDEQVSFHVKWDGKVIPDISFVSELRRVTEVVEQRAGMETRSPRMAPGFSRNLPLILKRPRTSDKSFEQWANKVWLHGASTDISLKDFRKDIRIEIVDDRGKVLIAFNVYRCWPSEYSALSKLEEDSQSLAMETLVLQYEGWERDLSAAAR
ncbi:MAG: phage tail protein [Calditrichae bacterium]|nr:phage tail protein [Calditrichia bacterium]